MMLYVLIAMVAGWLQDSGVKSLLLPSRSPCVNAHCARFVWSIKEEALDHMLMRGERSLYYMIQQYVDRGVTQRAVPPDDNKQRTRDAIAFSRYGSLLGGAGYLA